MLTRSRVLSKCSRPALGRTLRFALVLGFVLSIASHALAVGTRTFVLDTMDDFKGGDLTGVSVDSNGNVRAGFTLGAAPIPEATAVWCALELSNGDVLLGTGNQGKVYRVAGANVSVAATTDAWAITSMTLAWNGDVILGSLPDGKLYRMKADQKGGALQPFATLKGADDVFGVAFDPKAKAVYAATGPEGKLFRVDEQGKDQVFFKSEETYLMSVAVAEDGTVYAGSNGKALLYKILGPNRSSVLYDFNRDDVRFIVVAPQSQGGKIYAVANKYSDSYVPPKRNKNGPPGPQSKPSPTRGRGLLMRFTSDGIGEQLLEDDDSHYTALALDDSGAPYVGTGVEGRLYTVDDNHVSRIVVDTDERAVSAIGLTGKKKFVATSDPVVFHEVKGVGGADTVWTSKVLDCGLRATFGKVRWRSDGGLEFSGRTGNTEKPDTTWSAWSSALAAPGDMKLAPARYVQIRARWSRDPKAVLHEVLLPFVTDNERAIVKSIDVASKKPHSTSTGVAQSGGEAPKPQPSIHVSWKVDNPDQDELRYRVSYRLEGQTTWRNALKPNEKLTSTSFEWDTSALPEGTYRLMVEASDELANPPDRVTKHSLESGTVLVDNTPPVFKSLSMTGRRLQGEVSDGVGPIARFEVSVAGSDEWRPIFPKDGVFDSADEAIDTNLASLVPPGSHIVAVRAFDSAGNSVSRDVEAK